MKNYFKVFQEQESSNAEDDSRDERNVSFFL